MTKDEALRLALEALEKLWNIIDDIDTYSDMAKADEKLYRSLVERRQRQRFEETGISTDGYELHGGAITAIKAALEANEFNPDWDTQAVLVEEIQRMAKRIEELEAKDKPYAFEASMYSNDRVKIDPETGNVSIGTPQRTWVGLTEEEMEAAIPFGNLSGEYSYDDILNIILLIQAKLRSKND
jgi:hypothetical protein